MTNIQTVQQYFEYSNVSNFDKILELFTDTSTYSSQKTGLYVWAQDIIEMQKTFHASYNKLHWKVIRIDEEKPWIVKVDFLFTWLKQEEKIEFSAIEYLIIVDGKIQHIEIRNK